MWIDVFCNQNTREVPVALAKERNGSFGWSGNPRT